MSTNFVGQSYVKNANVKTEFLAKSVKIHDFSVLFQLRPQNFSEQKFLLSFKCRKNFENDAKINIDAVNNDFGNLNGSIKPIFANSH